MVDRVLAGRDGRLDDVGRGREVGLAGAEADDRLAGGLERLGLGVDGQGGGLGDGRDAAGDTGFRGHGAIVARRPRRARLDIRNLARQGTYREKPPGRIPFTGSCSPTLSPAWRCSAAWGGGSSRLRSCSLRSPLWSLRARPSPSRPASRPPRTSSWTRAPARCMAAKNVARAAPHREHRQAAHRLTAIERLPLDEHGHGQRPGGRAAGEQDQRCSKGQVWPFNDALRAAAHGVGERRGVRHRGARERQRRAVRQGRPGRAPSGSAREDTTFGDPAGLDDATSYDGGTAHERLRPRRRRPQRARRSRELADIAKALTYELTDPAGTAREFRNHNNGFLQTLPRRDRHEDRATPKQAGRTLVTAATRNGRTHDRRGARHLGRLRVGRATCSTAGSARRDGNGDDAPAGARRHRRRAPRRVHRHARRARRPALDGSRRDHDRRAPTTATATTDDATTKAKRLRDGEVVGRRVELGGRDDARPRRATTAAAPAGSSLGTIFNVRNFVIVVFVVLLTLFLLRRRAVRRQRARRIARQKRMAEIRRGA